MEKYTEQLKEKYGTDTLFTLNDIVSDYDEYDRIRKSMSDAVKKGTIKRAAQGVYYFPHITFLGTESVVSAEDIACKLYMDKDSGYYSGMTFVSMAGLTQQVPNTIEITTNNTKSRIRTVMIYRQKFVIRKSRIMVTQENKSVLPWLDLITKSDISVIIKNRDLIRSYINPDMIRSVIESYPPVTSKKLISGGII